MKKILLLAAALLGSALTAEAQISFKDLLSGVAAAAATTPTGTAATGKDAAKAAGSSALNSLITSTTAATSGSQAAGLIGNLIASVTGSATTTQANLIGAWTYTEPAVQFESQNQLTQAGGAAISTKVESQLAKYYKMVGIKEGKLKFTFANDGTCTYAVGGKELSGTYTFDEKAKTVTITTSTGQSVTTHVTISGAQMALTFDATKLLTLFTTLGSKFQTLSTLTALASNYDGMKLGFEFAKQ